MFLRAEGPRGINRLNTNHELYNWLLLHYTWWLYLRDMSILEQHIALGYENKMSKLDTYDVKT